MAEADAEHRHVRRRPASFAFVDRVRSTAGSPGPLLRNTPSGLGRQQLRRRRRRREHADVAAVRGEAAQDVPLHAEVVGGDRAAAAPARRSGSRTNSLVGAPSSAGGQSNGVVAGDVLAQVRAFHLSAAPRACSTSVVADRPSPVAMTPRMTPAERSTRVSARVSMSEMATMLLRDEVVAQRAVGRASCWRSATPRARRSRRPAAPRDSTSSVDDAVVADLRARHRDDLPGVRRIGQDFLVAGHAGVEHDFAGGLARRARRVAFEPGAVFERECCFHSCSRCKVTGTGARVPATTTTRPSHVRYPGASTRIVCRPCDRPGIDAGVVP